MKTKLTLTCLTVTAAGILSGCNSNTAPAALGQGTCALPLLSGLTLGSADISGLGASASSASLSGQTLTATTASDSGFSVTDLHAYVTAPTADEATYAQVAVKNAGSQADSGTASATSGGKQVVLHTPVSMASQTGAKSLLIVITLDRAKTASCSGGSEILYAPITLK